jgi:shikimate kinase/3-dehydroquinate synthase
VTALRRIALVGLPGSGKSTVAPLLARRLGWASVDTDQEVAADSGKPVARLITEEGEEAFRGLELAALQRCLRRGDPLVIACGGGLIAGEPARRLLTEKTCVVWLDAPDALLVGRVGDGGERPLLRGNPAERIPQLRAMRRDAHLAAHLHIPTDASPDAVAEQVAATLAGALRVAIPGRGYHVEVRPGALAGVLRHLPADAGRVALVADRTLAAPARRLVDTLEQAGREVTVVAVRGGEGLKTWAAAGRLLTRLSSAGLRRQDCVIALGGGTVGDVAGFVAATHLRGVAWINIPSTLLAMVDSAIGGKTGVNLSRGKNLAGAIWQPRAVICDPALLGSLADRPFRSAFAEIVKYSMIRDRGLASLLDEHLSDLLGRDPELLAVVVRQSCAIKAEIVAADEREAGERAVLNYGHTVGHALEAATGYANGLNHGEAVAVGMRAAGILSVRLLRCSRDDIGWQQSTLERCGLAGTAGVDAAKVLEHIAVDKKVSGTSVRWVLLEGRGRPRFGQAVPELAVREALDEVLSR